ncbi:MAG: DUF5718 family protein [Myxococcota bacterium]
MAEQSELILGVAGNFAGHLEQAGEAADFVDVQVAENLPKGLFPIFVPGLDHRLGGWPCSSDRLILPPTTTNVQPEPEIALRCRLEYDTVDGAPDRVASLVPYAFTAADDTSLRQPAQKIHEKKNWGPHSKGLSTSWIAIDRFDGEGVLAQFRLASFLIRGGTIHAYGEDSRVDDYTTKYQTLVHWMIDRLRHQPDEGPLDDIPSLVRQARHPQQAIFFIGATRYTTFGEQTFVQPDDEVIIVAYDARRHDADAVRDAVAHHRPLTAASVLRRRVLPAAARA